MWFFHEGIDEKILFLSWFFQVIIVYSYNCLFDQFLERALFGYISLQSRCRNG